MFFQYSFFHDYHLQNTKYLDLHQKWPRPGNKTLEKFLKGNQVCSWGQVLREELKGNIFEWSLQQIIVDKGLVLTKLLRLTNKLNSNRFLIWAEHIWKKETSVLHRIINIQDPIIGCKLCEERAKQTATGAGPGLG